ncbi:MAG: EamA family transporter, partial [Rhizorhabdus sp.]
QAGVQLAMNQGSARSLARAAASEPRLLVGLLLYALATVAWLFVLGRLPLSAAYPFVGLSFAVVLLLSWLALGEQPDAARLIGTALVITGVGFVARSSAT